MFYVLCAMCYVLCTMCCVLCAMCCVLCALCCVLCATCCVLCAMCYVLCAMCYVLCAVCYVLCAMCCVLCAVCCEKARIILCYFDCTKELSGGDYKRNRAIQSKVENLMGVDPDTALMVLGDINGRLKSLEPHIRASDANGRMVESWTEKRDLIHLNAMESCIGRYTFKSQNGKSAIDHVLVNEIMASRHISMWIDEDKTMLDISDHNLVRIWFKLGNDNHNVKKKIPRKRVTWISRNPVNILRCVSNFKARIGKKHNFKSCMEKLKTAANHTMKKTKVQKLGGKEKSFKKAAPWVDKELIENVNLRSKYNREWRYARKEGNEIKIKECKDKYYTQKEITASMVGNKKGGWEQKKITETLGDPAAFWRMIKLLLGKNKDNNEEAYIFDDEGKKTEIMNCKSEYLETWAAQVYQKLSKADFSFWSNTEGGEMQNMIRLMEEGNSGIMEDPIIEEKEFVDTC